MVTGRDVKKGDVWLVRLDPTMGSEIQKTRPCLIMSPDEMNERLRTVIVIPLTSGSHPAPFRVEISFRDKAGRLLCEQIRTVARQRLVQRLGRLDDDSIAQAIALLEEMFAP